MSKSKRHQVLQDIAKGLRGLALSDTADVGGHRYTMQVLSPEGEAWVTDHANGNTLATYAASTALPRLAAAITAIDDVLIEQLFVPGDDMPKEQREAWAAAAPTAQRDWRREELLTFLRDDFDTILIRELSEFYLRLDARHKEAVKDTGNLSTRTHSGV